jgi:hypothetical protein
VRWQSEAATPLFPVLPIHAEVRLTDESTCRIRLGYEQKQRLARKAVSPGFALCHRTPNLPSSLSVFKKLRQQLIPKLRLIPSVCLENTGC